RQGLAFDVAVEPMVGELADDVLGPGVRDLHLVEGLHRGEAGDRARLAGRGQCRPPISCCFRATMASAARAAPPPLSPSLARARAQAWSASSVVSTPLPMQSRRPMDSSMIPRALSLETISKW